MPQSRARLVTLSAPKKGWNARDPLSAMKPDHAVILENWVPGPNGVYLRNGCLQHVDGIGARVNTLMQFSGSSGGNKLFAAAGSKIHNVTNSVTIDPDVDFDVDDIANTFFSYTMFGNAGGNHLIACNGADDVLSYDGADWTTPTITGVTSADLIYVNAHAERLWFIEKQSTRVWYLAVDAIAGAATSFDLGSMLNLGGSIVAMASWTRDGGQGSDDVAVFISSKGEIVLFSGTDPDTSATWQRVGVFKIAPPVGNRCVIKAGADLGIITSQGVVPLSTILPISISQEAKAAITNTIEGAFNTAYLATGSLQGWQIVEYPRKQLLLVNVPRATGTEFDQFVMNVSTGAWCKFTGWPASCWALLGEELYYGTPDGRVMVLSDGYTDDGDPINADALPAFSDYKNANQKFFLQAKALFTAAQGTDPPIEIKLDYDTTPPSVFQSAVQVIGSPWGSPWGSIWGPPIISVAHWQSVAGHGTTASVRIKIASITPILWHETSITYEIGDAY